MIGFLAPVARVQQVAVAEVDGYVTDSSGQAIAGALVKATDANKGQVHTAATDVTGPYYLPSLAMPLNGRNPADLLRVTGFSTSGVLPKKVENWSLTSLQQRLVKTGGRLVQHARHCWLMLAESHLTGRLFGAMVGRIAALPVPTG